MDEDPTDPTADASGAAFLVDRRGRIARANDSCAVVFESVVEELLNRRVTDLAAAGFLPERFPERLRAAREELVEGDRGRRSLETQIHPGGEGDPHTYEVELELVDPGPGLEGEDQTTGGETRRRTGGADGDRGLPPTLCVLRDVGTRFRYEETVDALNRRTRELMAADSEEEVMTLAGEAANEVLGFPGVGVRMYDPEAEVLRHVAFGGVVNEIDARPPYSIEDSPHGRAFERGETVIEEIPEVGDPYDREVFSHTMYVPMGDYGVLSFGRIGGPFDAADVHFAEILAENARAALGQVERKRRLREQRRRLQKRNERLDEFASVVSHDLRNPLGVAKGALAQYRRDGDADRLDDVEYGLQRMDEIVAEVLALAREGLTVDDPVPVDLGAVARAAWRNVETRELSLSVDSGGTVTADRDRLLRLFENCYRNTVEHGDGTGTGADGTGTGTDGTGAGGGEEAAVAATTVRVGATGDGFYVADDGAGIPPADRERVFDSEFTTARDGTGYGLAIVERIVEAHGWAVRATESREGGARFEVSGARVELNDGRDGSA